MSKVTNILATENQLITNYDVSKFLLGFNSFASGDVTASGADVVTLQGMVMGRISATNLIVPMDKDATDGSQYPVGLCVIDNTVTDGTTETLQLVNKGKVAESKINFLDVETLDTPVGVANNQKTIRDWLNDLGLILAGGEELTKIDNQ